MEISTDVNELNILIYDILSFIETHGIKSQIIFYNVSTLIHIAGWKRIYTFLIALVPQFKSVGVVSFFIFSPETHENQSEVEIMRHLGDSVFSTG